MFVQIKIRVHCNSCDVIFYIIPCACRSDQNKYGASNTRIARYVYKLFSSLCGLRLCLYNIILLLPIYFHLCQRTPTAITTLESEVLHVARTHMHCKKIYAFLNASSNLPHTQNNHGFFFVFFYLTLFYV